VPLAFPEQLPLVAEVIVRTGLNLQAGQRLLIAEPYQLQGVSREAAALVAAVEAAARQAGATGVDVIWGDEAQLRRFAERGDRRSFEHLVARNSQAMALAVVREDALLFLEASHAGLLAGVPSEQANVFSTLAWSYFGPVARQLAQGATNWTVACAPIPSWAEQVYTDRPAGERLDCLWADVLAAMRITPGTPALAGWQQHLAALRQQCDAMNRTPLGRVRFTGPGTDLTVGLAPKHLWCTAALATRSGRRFVANLPTEEIFTAPHRDAANGRVRVRGPVAYGGEIMDGIELEFFAGRVVRARARVADDLLHRILAIDAGASRLGEVAWVPRATAVARAGRFFLHPLLDENAGNHVALGQAYAFTIREGVLLPPRRLEAAGANHSLIHVDLPLDAEIELLPG
jgi:aminopeptidase